MLFITPKTLEDAKNIIEGIMTKAPEGKLARTQEALDNFNTMCDVIGGFFKGCSEVIKFIGMSIKDPSFLIDKIQFIAPDIVLIVLAILIVLRFLGFKNTTKYIVLAFVIAAIIATL